MVTAAGRFDTFCRSLKCYVDQTYLKRELVIINEGPKEYQTQIDHEVQRLDRSDIRTVWLDGEYTLGSLRNISMALATGDLICQWDDDDLSMPHRLAVQCGHLLRQRATVCYLSDQLHYYYHTHQLYWDNWKKFHSGGKTCFSLIPGTLMAHRDLGIRYPSSGEFSSAGEDSVFANKLLASGVVTLLSGMGHMHVYTYHGTQQVFDIEHHFEISKQRSQTREDVLRHRSEICDTINYLELPGETKVMCRDGLAFIHGGAQ